MSETVINLFLDILAAVYTNFAILYFSRRLLPVRNKISLFFLLILFTLPMSLCFLMKRSTLSGEFTILIQLLILGCVFIGFHASFLQKLAVYFIFVLLETCAEIVASSVFLQIHNLLFPTVMYTPSTLRSQCSPVEFLIIQFFNMALGLFLLEKVAHILQQCFSYLKTVTFFELLSPVILPALANNLLALPCSLFLRIFFCILYWVLCVLGSFLFYRSICTLRLQHEKHICHQQEALLLKKQLNASKTLSAEYASLRKWNHDIENHLFSLSYLIIPKITAKQTNIWDLCFPRKQFPVILLKKQLHHQQTLQQILPKISSGQPLCFSSALFCFSLLISWPHFTPRKPAWNFLSWEFFWFSSASFSTKH